MNDFLKWTRRNDNSFVELSKKTDDQLVQLSKEFPYKTKYEIVAYIIDFYFKLNKAIDTIEKGKSEKRKRRTKG